MNFKAPPAMAVAGDGAPQLLINQVQYLEDSASQGKSSDPNHRSPPASQKPPLCFQCSICAEARQAKTCADTTKFL